MERMDVKMHEGVTGHRGNPERMPENTMDSFVSAIALGVDWLELDVHLTKDGRLAVIHDSDTARVGDIALTIADSTAAELSKVDVATLFRRTHGLSLEECPPRRIPFLDDIIELLIGMPGCGPRLSIQPKADCVEEALALADRLGAAGIIGFNDGDLDKMLAVKRHARGIPVFWDRFGSNVDDDIAVALESGFECVVRHMDGVGIEDVQKLHKAGLKAGVWTVNEDSDMRRFLAMGVDRFYTDRPEALIKAKTEMGLRCRHARH